MVVTPVPPSQTALSLRRMKNLWCEQNLFPQRKYPSVVTVDIFKFIIISSIFILIIFMIFLHLCNSVTYVTFSTNLTLNHKKKNISRLPQCLTIIPLLLFGLLSAESPEKYFSLLIILPDLNYGNLFSLGCKCRKAISQTLLIILSIYIFYLATTPSACILCFLLFQTLCYSLTRNNPQWLQILLSNDVHQNPGPAFHSSFSPS